jgi:lipopolysaccharide heptosyltransferase II
LTNIQDKHRLLIIRLSSLGDILLTTPLIRSLNKKYENLQIDFLLRREYQELLLYNPYINKIYLYERKSESNIELLEELKKNNYDLIIDLQNNYRSYKIVSQLKVPVKKFHKHSLDKFLLVKFKINNLKDEPQIPERYAETLNEFELDNEGLDLFIGNVESPLSKKEYSDLKTRNVGFAPGARHFTKRWPEEFYVNLGKKLVDAGYSILLFGGKDDKEICSGISALIPGSINLCSDDEVLITASGMKECIAIVCNDSGLMHIACAMKIPVLVFFGSSVKEFGFTPYKNNNLIIENKSLSCRPCSHIGREQCPKTHFKCMLELTPDIAYQKLLELLNR